jgi:hypothetical protein
MAAASLARAIGKRNAHLALRSSGSAAAERLRFGGIFVDYTSDDLRGDSTRRHFREEKS